MQRVNASRNEAVAKLSNLLATPRSLLDLTELSDAIDSALSHKVDDKEMRAATSLLDQAKAEREEACLKLVQLSSVADASVDLAALDAAIEHAKSIGCSAAAVSKAAQRRDQIEKLRRAASARLEQVAQSSDMNSLAAAIDAARAAGCSPAQIDVAQAKLGILRGNCMYLPRTFHGQNNCWGRPLFDKLVQ